MHVFSCFLRIVAPLSLVLCLAHLLPAQTFASLQGRTLRPGHATRVTLLGTDFNDSLRVVASRAEVSVQVVQVEPTQAVIEATIADKTPSGPIALQLAFASGAMHQAVMLIDDLEPVVDQGNNHDQATAQSVSISCSIEGTCDASLSDFYRFTATAGDELSFAVHTQALRSPMDPVVRLFAANGQLLHEADDDTFGPECAFRYRFEAEGAYWIEIHDSRYAAAAAPYQLRIGDFPVVQQAYPALVASDTPSPITMLDRQGAPLFEQSVNLPTSTLSDVTYIDVRTPQGKSSSWLPLLVSRLPLHCELSAEIPSNEQSGSPVVPADATSQPTAPLNVPIAICGRLQQPDESDSYRIAAAPGQKLRIAARTRSLGSPTLLKMQLFASNGSLIAETKVTETDEWNLEAVVPEATTAEPVEVRLQVSDLLKRGGAAFTYAVEISHSGTFTVALNAAAATAEQFAIEPKNGAAAIDLQITRLGYDGAIDLSWLDSPKGIRILNPRIAAGATTARVYLIAGSEWEPHTLSLAHLQATATDLPTSDQASDQATGKPPSDSGVTPTVFVGSRELRRVKEPHLLTPPDCLNGALTIAAVDSSPTFFAFQPASPIQFARTVLKHAATLSLQRTQPEFKGAVELLPMELLQQLPEQHSVSYAASVSAWKMESKVEGDTYNLTLERPANANLSLNSDASADSELTHVPLLTFAQHNGRGQVQLHEMPIEWIDPVKVRLDFPEPLVRGGPARVRANITRQGTDPQPITLAAVELPAGVTLPQPVNVAADQSEVEFDLVLSPDVDLPEGCTLKLNATSQYGGSEFSVAVEQLFPTLVASPLALSVFPAVIELNDLRDRQQLVVTGKDAIESERDWTRHARLTVARPELAEIRHGAVMPLASGETELIVEVGNSRRTIPLNVAMTATPRRVDFESEVLVALSKQGCNSGACHGSPSGKGGFRLSLRAFDLQLDQLTLIREDFGRRINPLAPERSLLLLKPLMKVQHGGGKQLKFDSTAYKLLHDWVAAGGTTDPPETPRIAHIEVFPKEKRILSVADGGQQLAITAHFTDGSKRDVTHIASYESSDGEVATVDRDGWVQPHARGEVAILVRCLEYIEAVPLMFVDNQADFHWNTPPQNNYVDTLVDQKLQQLQYLPSTICSDSEFLRRASLDVLGVLPTVEETTAFLADSDPDKRAKLVDTLLDRPEYAKFWALKWGDLLKLTGKLVGDEGVYKYYRWLEASLRDNQPYDQFARDLLTGSGSTLANPPANFYRTATDMNESVETISQVFLGARLQCAKCHNHPFERWTQDNYYGLGAFFNRIERRTTQRPGEMFIYTSAAGEVTQPRTGKVMQPWLPQHGSIAADGDADRRLAFAEWLVAPENPYFARIEANRLWSHLFTRGIVDPIDDFRDSNPPSNAPLLDALAQDFIDSGYDRKHLLRVILNSRTYQASYQTNDFNREDSQYFSHQEPRLLSAEQLLDAINHTLSLTQKLGNLPPGTLATQMPAPDIAKVDFLKVFGQPERSTVCACERADDSNLGMAIELFNGPMMHDKLRDANNRFRVSLAAGKSVSEIVRELYLAALCRPPSETELQVASAHCENASEPAIGLEDVCWALFNTDEFLFQH